MHLPTMTSLEFTRIQQELGSHAACQLGKELALDIQPQGSLAQVRRLQQETSEAVKILTNTKSVPFGGIQDIRQAVERAETGVVLRPEQLVAVADTIYGCRQLATFLKEQMTIAPLLGLHAAAFGRFDAVEEEIRRCIERGVVASRASRPLKQIRSEIGILETRIQDRLQGLLKQFRLHLQEALVTTRNGRYVIPVKASARASVPGKTHGASASGSTIFIEPTAVNQLCDELETWRAMETAEVEKVLIALSGTVADHAHGLKGTLQAAARLDLIVARGRLSLAWDARPVTWNEGGLIDLKNARHPLLGKNAVGNRIRLTAESRMLVVTGPNTGGKTLLLKTLGLLILTAQSGMHLPVDEGSSLCLFTKVFADIGDHQSLEQSLSTFSGHIASISPMLAEADPQTLILLDELGSGTDPHEGTGLGIALLEAFLQKGAYTLATTHLREIKEFGRITPGCAYAGMGFDGSTLQPTYRLIQGTLGESHGLEIAARAGLPMEVVERARQLVYGASAGLAGATDPAARDLQTPSPENPATAQEPQTQDPQVPEPAPQHGPPGLATVLDAVSPSRARVWQDGLEREMTVRDSVRQQMPTGLVPGDRVRVRDGQVVEVLSRSTLMVSRSADTFAESVVAANASQLLIVVSARQPDFHQTVLARHLLYAERQGLKAIICLTKAELVPKTVAWGWLEPFKRTGYQTVIVSALKRWGLEELQTLLANQTTAVIANPMAGKSTLLKALTGTTHQATDDHPQAYSLAPDTWLIDLPGLRALGVWKPDLVGGLRDFSPFTAQCLSPGCLHRDETGCGVLQAVEEGSLDRQRHAQYLLLLQHMRLI